MELLKTILLSQITLTLAVFVHELGHFFAMRAFGIRVETFSVGFGKGWTLFKWKETEFMLTPFIFGGYVMPNTESYEEAQAYKKLIVSLAGPVAGLLAAIIPFFIVEYFFDGGGFLSSLLFACTVPFVIVWKLYSALFGFLGVFFEHTKEVVSQVTVASAGRASSNYTFMEDSDGKMFALKLGALSIGLSVLNMIPVPPLDGGHVVTHLYEMIFRRKANKHVVLWITLVVVLLFVVLFLLSIFNDVKALF